MITVVWDGRRNGPGGAHLVTPYEEPRAPRPRRVEYDTRPAVLEQLRAKPQTLRELVASTRLSSERVNAALWHLQADGEVVKVGDRPRAEAQYGRMREYVYGLA